jgi:hypothetical protein
MSYYIYSTEALPNTAMMGKPGYTPDNEFIRWMGLTLPPIPARKWTKLPDALHTIRRQDWRDRHGTAVEVQVQKFSGIINANFAKRGVVFLDHEPSTAEKAKLEEVSEELNIEWRRECIQNYENQVRDKEVTGTGRTKPTPYEDECYDILKMEKPYSVKHFQAMRNPGNEAAQKIADAISAAQKPLVDLLLDTMTKPKAEPARK